MMSDLSKEAQSPLEDCLDPHQYIPSPTSSLKALLMKQKLQEFAGLFMAQANNYSGLLFGGLPRAFVDIFEHTVEVWKHLAHHTMGSPIIATTGTGKSPDRFIQYMRKVWCITFFYVITLLHNEANSLFSSKF